MDNDQKFSLAPEFRPVSPETFAKIAASMPGAFIRDGMMFVETEEGTDSIGYVDKTSGTHMVRVK